MQNFIRFKNISFKYEGSNEYAISNFNLSISRGEKIGLVGHSGAGKSTIVNLLLKNFAITNYQYWDRTTNIRANDSDQGGDILINGQSIYDVSSDSLRSKIALIPQDIMLFHRTIGENIGYAKDNVTLVEIENASKMAKIHDFIMSLPDKYDTMVGERGVKLSGGQRQRIAIARAILKDAPILILDEATSSLDSQTENEIQESLNILIDDKSKTVIAIAHRLSTLKHMDKIIVLNEGQIVEEGTHDSLIANENSMYKKLWDMQEI
jgi:ATP-binding cassette subfamily B protein